MAECLFCRIARGEVASDLVYESDDVVGFSDINPAAPTHVLVVPRRHISSVEELSGGDGALLGAMFEAMNRIADDARLDGGFRVVTNVGADAGQSVHHLHFHVLGGRRMGWPPG